MDFVCKHCLEVFRGVEASHHLSTHLMQKHKGVIKPEPFVDSEENDGCPYCGQHGMHVCPRAVPYRQISKPIPIERKANPMHLRDVAMNQIGEWTGVDIQAQYWTPDRHMHSCMFVVNGKRFLLEVKELN